jgi:hypothetical protein
MPTNPSIVSVQGSGRRLVLQQGDPPHFKRRASRRALPAHLDTLESEVATMTRTVGRVNSLTLLVGPLLRWHPHHRRRC